MSHHLTSELGNKWNDKHNERYNFIQRVGGRTNSKRIYGRKEFS